MPLLPLFHHVFRFHWMLPFKRPHAPQVQRGTRCWSLDIRAHDNRKWEEYRYKFDSPLARAFPDVGIFTCSAYSYVQLWRRCIFHPNITYINSFIPSPVECLYRQENTSSEGHFSPRYGATRDMRKTRIHYAPTKRIRRYGFLSYDRNILI